MTEIDNVQTIVDTAVNGVEPDQLTPGGIYAFKFSDSIKLVDLTGDEYRDQPKRKTGTTVVDDLDSFVRYFGKHSDAASELYVNVKKRTITAVLDAHTQGGARWGEHQLVLQLTTADKWNDWIGMNRKPMTQVEWAEFLEDHADDVREPDAATMLEIANTFQAATKITFKSSIALSNGSQRLQWEEDTTASAGSTGNLEVPKTFLIGVAPFDFAAAFKVWARFRYRISGGKLAVSYLLDDPDAVVRDAVLDIVEKLEQALTPEVEEGQEPAQPSHKVMRGVSA